MLYFRRVAVVCLLVLLVWSSTGIGADLPDALRITRIKFEGAHALKKKEILSAMAIKTPAVWRIWAKRPVASEEDLADDAKRIEQLYSSYGFYNANVFYTVETGRVSGDDPVSARVVYAIEEGAPVLVDSIVMDLGDQEPLVPIEDLLQSIPLKKGSRFEEKIYRESKKLLQKQFGARGYPFAQVSGKALVYPTTNKAEVTFSIDAGRQCFFGETTVIADAVVINEKIIKRARTYRPGEIYDSRKVEKSQRNLYNLDVFKAAVIKPGETESDTGRVPMSLELKPRKQQTVKVGIGYGDEDGVRLKGGWIYRNLLGWAGKLSLEAKRSDLIEKISASYDQPYFFDSKSLLRAEAGTVREMLDAYESLNFFGTVRYTRNLKRYKTITAAYLSEYSELRDLNLLDPEEREAFRKDNSYYISSILLELNRKKTDSDTNPKKGSHIIASVEIAPSLLASELTYFKPSIELTNYRELPFGTILAGRVKFETISDVENNEKIPVFKRLFLGGANSVRGYAYQKVGPLDASGNPDGGQSTALANIELRRPIVGMLSGVLFLDVGMVTEDEYHMNVDDLRYSAGGGIRFDTPVGPLRLDVGYKLNPPDYPSETVQMDRWRLHFSIGHAF